MYEEIRDSCAGLVVQLMELRGGRQGGCGSTFLQLHTCNWVETHPRIWVIWIWTRRCCVVCAVFVAGMLLCLSLVCPSLNMYSIVAHPLAQDVIFNIVFFSYYLFCILCNLYIVHSLFYLYNVFFMLRILYIIYLKFLYIYSGSPSETRTSSQIVRSEFDS